MGIEYDTHTWGQRSVFLLMSLLYLLTLVFVGSQFLTGVKVITAKYGRNILLVFFAAVCCAFVCRTLYAVSGEGALMLPLAPYGVCAHFPGMFLLTASLCFMNYMFRSLASRFEKSYRDGFRRYECIVDVFLAVIWPAQVAIYSMVIYWSSKSGETAEARATQWLYFYMYILLAAFIGLMPLVTYVFVVYMRELRRFPYTFQEKRDAIHFVIAVTALQGLCRIGNSVLISTGTAEALEHTSVEQGIPYAQLVYGLYIICADLMSLVAYTLYLRKDLAHLVIVELETTGEREYASSFLASTVEHKISCWKSKSTNTA